MEVVFGGKVEDLRPFLLEERIVDGWVPWSKKCYSITMGAFNYALVKIGLHTRNVLQLWPLRQRLRSRLIVANSEELMGG